MSTRIIKCSNCGVFNTNKEYCENCGVLISDQKKRALKEQEVKKAEVEEEIYKLENPNFVKRLKKHPNFLFRIVGWVLYSAITIVSLIGSGLAWFIAMVAAG